MKLLIDLQGAQSESRHRGIGRYSLALALELVRQAGDDEVHILLNAQLHESIDELRAEFEPLLSKERIHIWSSPAAVRQLFAHSTQARIAAEVMREHVIADINPDLVLLSSLFEGFGDDSVTSIGRAISRVPSAVVLYDLIPMLNPGQYLSHPLHRDWYYRKLDHLRRADLLLAISESTAAEAIRYLGLSPEQVVNIAGGYDSRFCEGEVSEHQRRYLASRWNVSRPFALYTSGGDARKNNEGLIVAWAKLPERLRKRHQLVIVSSSLGKTLADGLEATARHAGLGGDDFVCLMNCSDDDLLLLYRACELFVFPSFHEGFGLPLVEAMACGRAVIAADTTSLPEVMGRNDALFDPYDNLSMAAMLATVLESPSLRRDLEAHSRARSKRFTWQECARSAWQAIRACKRPPRVERGRPRLLYVPLLSTAPAPALALEAAWVPEWARHFQLDFLIEARGVTPEWSFGGWRSAAFVQENGHRYSHVVYAIAQKDPPAHVIDLMDQWPGHVLLLVPPDIRLPVLSANPSACSGRRALVRHGGWQTLVAAMEQAGTAGELPFLPAEQLLEQARSVITVGWSSEPWGSLAAPVAVPVVHRRKARAALGLLRDEFVVCIPDAESADSEQASLFCKALSQALSRGMRARVFVVGRATNLPFLSAFQPTQRQLVVVSGTLDSAARERWLDAADLIAVLPPLELPSSLRRYEVLRYMARDSIVAAPLPAGTDPLLGALVRIPDADDPESVAAVARQLESVVSDRQSYKQMQRLAHGKIAAAHGLRASADALSHALHATPPAAGAQAAADEMAYASPGLDETSREVLARSLTRNFRPPLRRPQLLVDVSELAQRDARSGIQRVVRAVLLEMLRLPDRGFDIQPVYATASEAYRYARRFTAKFIGAPADWVEDDFVEAWRGDIFFGLDYQTHVVLAQAEALREWYRRGVQVHFMIYDLLPIKQPHFFADGARVFHSQWLSLLSELSGTICISRTVANEYHDWINAFGAERRTKHVINWTHIGADVQNSAPSKGLPSRASAVLDSLQKRPTWLMVGTVEPRKGHQQTVDAFDRLWRTGFNGNLVIVGKQGWHVEELSRQLTEHPECDRRLFWLRDASDEFLELLYAKSICLITASEGEGFGLPLIEASQHATPLICRDLPVFREVAGDHAEYFADVGDPEAIAEAVLRFQAAFSQNRHRKSEGVEWVTWRQCAERCLDLLLGARPYLEWVTPTQRSRWGNDVLATSEVGMPRGESMVTNHKAGWLYAGPAQQLPAGHHRLRVDVQCKKLVGLERIDIVQQATGMTLASRSLGSAQALPATMDVEFHLIEPAPAAQARIWVEAGTVLALQRVGFVLHVSDAAATN